jgi:hypothetical protein
MTAKERKCWKHKNKIRRKASVAFQGCRFNGISNFYKLCWSFGILFYLQHSLWGQNNLSHKHSRSSSPWHLTNTHKQREGERERESTKTGIINARKTHAPKKIKTKITRIKFRPNHHKQLRPLSPPHKTNTPTTTQKPTHTHTHTHKEQNRQGKRNSSNSKCNNSGHSNEKKNSSINSRSQ